MALRFYRANAPWLATGMVLTFGSAFGQTYFISLFAGNIRAEFGLSDGAWGGIYTIATLASACVLVQASRLADQVPLARLAIVVLFTFAAMLLLMAASPNVWVLGFAVFGLRFCGQGLMSQIAMTAMARWFRANRGRAIAIAVMGYPLGEGLLPLITVPLSDAIGWRLTWVAAAAVVACVLLPLLAWLMRHDRVPQGEGDENSAVGLYGRHWNRRNVLGHWSFWVLVPGILANGFIGTVVFFHQVHIAEVRGWDLATMAYAYPVYASVSVLIAFLTGFVVDRIGATRLLPVYLLPMGAGLVVLSTVPGVAAWFLMLALAAATQGLASTLLGALWPTIYGTRHIGAIKGLAFAVMVVSTALGPGLTGLLIDAGITFIDQALAMAAWCLVASFGFVTVAARLRAALPLSTETA